MTNPTREQVEERLRHAAQQAHEKQREAERAFYETADENAALQAKITQWENWQANDQGLEAAKTQEIRSLRKALNLRREVQTTGVNPDWIKDQRTSNWPDMHPEDFCHKCGSRNPAWAAEPDDWDTATASWAAETGREGICCVSCFADMHRAETGEYSLWVLKRVGQKVSPPESSESPTAALVAAAGVTPQEPGERAALLAEVDAAKVRPALHDIPDLLFRVRAVLAAPAQVELTELAQIAIAEIEKFEATAGPNRPLSHAGIWIARAVHERLRGGGQ